MSQCLGCKKETNNEAHPAGCVSEQLVLKVQGAGVHNYIPTYLCISLGLTGRITALSTLIETLMERQQNLPGLAPRLNRLEWPCHHGGKASGRHLFVSPSPWASPTTNTFTLYLAYLIYRGKVQAASCQ